MDRSRRRALLGMCAVALGCGASDPTPASNGASGSSATTASGMAGSAGSPASSSTGVTSTSVTNVTVGTTGSSVVGAGGGAGSGSGGSGGEAGSAGQANDAGSSLDAARVSDASRVSDAARDAGGCEELGTPGKNGRQCDPTAVGNGTFEEMEPGTAIPPEGMPARRGMITASQSFRSTIYGYNFNYQVFVPIQYVAGKAAALMIFQDGGNYVSNFRTPQIFETLIDAKTMPVTIAVFITPGNDRSGEYDSITDKYVRFLLEELIPQKIAPAYSIVDDPNGWAIGGHSSGGICAFTAGWQRPTVFHKILTNSGSFVNLQGNMSGGTYPTIVSMATPNKPLRVTMSSGTTDLGGWRAANDKMAMALADKGYPYRYVRHGGSHGPDKWVDFEYPNALRWLWRGYTLSQYP